MTASRPSSTRALTALAALLTAAAFAAPATARTPAHHTKKNRHELSAAARRIARAQSTSISNSLKHSTGLRASQVGTKDFCDSARRDMATCNVEALVNRHTHQLLHPRIAREHAHLTRTARHGRSAHTAAGADTAPGSAFPPSPATPAWLQQAYDTTWLSANRGSGDTVAVVDAGADPTAASDLAEFRSYFGLPACTTANGCFTELNQNGQTQASASSWPSPVSGWQMEISMDLAAVSSLCPNCHIVLVEANSALMPDLIAAESAAANYPGVSQISDSWGMMENAAVSSAGFVFPNVSIVASSGDYGYEQTAGPQYPTSFPNVVSAGGTSLSTGSVSGYRGFTETAWDGAGSTCNSYLAKPSWQHGACAGRAATDVSADADPDTGLAFVSGGSWTQAGGTSLSSPLIAAFEALTQPTIKTGQWAYNDASLLDDITLGNNDTPANHDDYGTCSATLAYICKAGTGYDGPTGNGSILGDIATGGPGIAGPDVCAASGCAAGSEGYVATTTATAAEFKAAVYRNGLATSYYWQYGTSDNFGSQTPTVALAAAATAAGFTTTVTGLSASTTYYYRLVATNADGSAYGYTYSFETGALPVHTTAPSITGTAQQGQLLTAHTGAWTPTPTSYSYQWQRNTGSGFVNISGATAATYTPGSADLNATIDAVISAHDAMGVASAATAATGPVASGAPVNLTTPTVTGTLKQGVALSIAVGSWSPAATSYSYQWQRNTGSGFTNISGATAATYTPGVADLGATLQVLVTGHNAYGTATVTASPTASGTVASGAPVNSVAPTITGTAARGDTLSVSLGSWSPSGTPSYQWYSCAGSTCNPISGATASSYVPVIGLEGDTLELAVTETNTYGHSTVTTAATAAVVSNPPTNSVAPTITGTAIETDTLTAHAGTWGPTGVALTYVWEACSGSTCTAISGATAATFKLTAAQLGDTIELQVTGTDADGNLVKTSAATATVAA